MDNWASKLMGFDRPLGGAIERGRDNNFDLLRLIAAFAVLFGPRPGQGRRFLLWRLSLCVSRTADLGLAIAAGPQRLVAGAMGEHCHAVVRRPVLVPGRAARTAQKGICGGRLGEGSRMTDYFTGTGLV